MRILLTGYRACGKTTVGRRLAIRLGWEFIDTDAVIQAAHGDIAAMVEKHGWPRFRELEEKTLVDLGGRENAVIATGGGAVMHRQAWEKLRRGALVVWLAVDAATVRRRLARDPASPGQRPGLTGVSAVDEIDMVMAEREPLYRRGSDVKIDAGLPVVDIVDNIEKTVLSGRVDGE